MSERSVPLTPTPSLFLEPTMSAAGPAEGPGEHHPRPKPADHMCTCGKVREACVHDEVRALWQAVAES